MSTQSLFKHFPSRHSSLIAHKLFFVPEIKNRAPAAYTALRAAVKVAAVEDVVLDAGTVLPSIATSRINECTTLSGVISKVTGGEGRESIRASDSYQTVYKQGVRDPIPVPTYHLSLPQYERPQFTLTPPSNVTSPLLIFPPPNNLEELSRR